MTNKKSAATRFEEWLTFRSFAPGSIRDYLHCFNQFANSLPEDTDFFNLDVQLAIDYVFALRKKGCRIRLFSKPNPKKQQAQSDETGKSLSLLQGDLISEQEAVWCSEIDWDQSASGSIFCKF